MKNRNNPANLKYFLSFNVLRLQSRTTKYIANNQTTSWRTPDDIEFKTTKMIKHIAIKEAKFANNLPITRDISNR